MFFRELDKQVLVADAPMQARYMADAAARGVTLVINNRPDGEAFDQIDSATLGEAAKAAGMAYLHLPVGAEFPEEKVAALSEALAGVGEGRALVFCRTGTRSTYLWALARARAGAVPEALVANAGRAGYDLRPLLSWLRQAPGAPH